MSGGSVSQSGACELERLARGKGVIWRGSPRTLTWPSARLWVSSGNGSRRLVPPPRWFREWLDRRRVARRFLLPG